MPRTVFHRNLALVALLATATHAALADIVVDDFSSGSFSRAFAAPPDGRAYGSFEQTGSMASGARIAWLYARGPGPADVERGALFDVSPGSFEFRSNAGVGHRLEWSYGTTYVSYHGGMDLDFSGEQALRFRFDEAPRGLNFNVLLYYDHRADNYSQLGMNIAPRTTPFDVDFAMADFARVVRRPDLGADLSHVTGIYIVSQSGAYVASGGEGFRLNSIATVSAVPEPASGALALAGLGLLLGRRQLRRRDAGVR